MTKILMTSGEIAEILLVSSASVRRWGAKGAIHSELDPQSKKTKFGLLSAVQYRVAELRETEEKLRREIEDLKEGSGNLRQQKLVAEIENLEIKNRSDSLTLEERLRQVAPVEETQKLIAAGINLFIVQMLSLPPKLAGEFAGMNDPDHISNRMDNEIKVLVQELKRQAQEAA